jgi:hypothetical protein
MSITFSLPKNGWSLPDINMPERNAFEVNRRLHSYRNPAEKMSHVSADELMHTAQVWDSAISPLALRRIGCVLRQMVECPIEPSVEVM